MQGQQKTGAYNSRMYDWKFDIINRYTTSQHRKLLDIGCGDGKFVFEASKRDYQAQGIDLSPDRIRQGREFYGLGDQIQNMNIDDFTGKEKFDIITLWDLIEHLESPSSLLAKLERISHFETLIFILTMSLDSITYKWFGKHWNYINPPQHLYYFSHDTMHRMLKKNKLELLGYELDDSRNKHFLHFLHSIYMGQVNNFLFWLVKKSGLLALVNRTGKKERAQRLHKRLENLYPGKYFGRYHDNFVYTAKLKGRKNNK